MSAQAACADGLSKLENCMAVTQFATYKVQKTTWKYSKADVKIAGEGLAIYSAYLQDDFLGPIYQDMGDASEAAELQAGTDARVAKIVSVNKTYFSKARIYPEQAVELYMCAGFLLPDGERGRKFLKAVTTLEKMSQK